MASDTPGVPAVGLDLGIASGFGNDFLSLGPAKVFLDGSLLGETAAVSQEYCSHGTHGQQQATPATSRPTRRQLRNGSRRPTQLAGPSPRTPSATAPSTWPIRHHHRLRRQSTGRRRVPNRIEHASMTRPDQLPRLADSRHRRYPAGQLLPDGGDGMTASLGPAGLRWAYRAASLPGRWRDPRRQLGPARGRRQRVLRGMQAFVDRRNSLRRRVRQPGRAADARPGTGGLYHRRRSSHRHSRTPRAH